MDIAARDGHLQVIYNGVTYVDDVVESLEFSTHRDGSVSLTARATSVDCEINAPTGTLLDGLVL